jgi:hypothetical protein
MKKIVLAISALLMTAVVITKVSNAQTTPQEVKKTSTEAKMDCGKNHSVSDTVKMACSKTGGKICDPAKCKEGKCDTAKCKASCVNSKDGKKKCDPAKCSGMTKK